MASRVVLITGVADYWGSRLAERLAAEPEMHVIGLDVAAPREKIADLDFVQADLRNPALADLLKSERVQTVCHLKFVHSVRHREAAFDANVSGTIKLLDACAVAGVGKVVLKSSTSVYGAHPDNSAFLTEAHAFRGGRRYAYTHHLLEIETLCDDFRRRNPALTVTQLRFANIVGPTADTPMTSFLKNKWAQPLLGFDPMLQIIHEADVVEALAHATLTDAPGVFNVASDPAMPLSQVMALAGKQQLPVPHPFTYWGIAALRIAGANLDRYAPIEPDYLRYPWVADLSKMRQELGFEPRYTAEETLRQFAARSRFISSAAILASEEERLRATTERRRQLRDRKDSDSVKGNQNE